MTRSAISTFVLSALTLVPMACSGGGSSSGTDAGDDTCSFGATRCNGQMFQTCQDGVFTDYEMCYETCDQQLGCTGEGPGDQCKVNEDIDGTPSCSDKAPPDSFEPEIQWSYSGEVGEPYSWVTPLVANMTDDNGDLAIDLCDVPDVVVVGTASTGYSAEGHIVVLDGQTGAPHFRVDQPVDATVTPALGDIDGDGIVEIISMTTQGNIIALEHDGTLKWIGSDVYNNLYSAAVALADVDNDGDVEISIGEKLYDHDGNHLQTFSIPAPTWSSTAIADLDGDGDQEIVLGNAAFHHDGTMLYSTPQVVGGYPQVANLDSDPEPEVLITGTNGISVLEHDGQVKFQDRRPTGAPAGYTTWIRPATIHDFDGDGQPEFAVSSASSYAVYEADGTILWDAPVSDQSGIAAGTAFDFLGDGTAEAMYADEQSLFVFDDAGEVLLQIPRASGTLSEYPVVADIDNDGSAEIVVISNTYYGSTTTSPMVQVIRDVEDRWIQARRIWNQHTYHVTNVREDGTIPQFESPSWKSLNTFRTNAQIEEGGVCEPWID